MLRFNEVRIFVKGNPVPKARPRFTKRGFTYDVQGKQKTDFLLQVKSQMPDKLMTGPIQMKCLFKIQRPKSHYRAGKYASKLKPSSPVHHIQRPDTDNYAKFCMDCLNGVAYKDDSQVFMLEAHKAWTEYGEDPETLIDIMEYLGDSDDQ